MTLNITSVGSEAVIQVSDRRFVDANTGHIRDDSANKAIVIGFGESMAVLTFTGVGTFLTGSGRTERMDWWLASKMQRAGIPELGPTDAANFIAKEATRLFQVFPASHLTQHEFVLAGFHYSSGAAQPFGVIIHNNDESTHRPLSLFHVDATFVPSADKTGFLVTGMQEALGPSEFDNMIEELQGIRRAQEAEEAMVKAIRRAASNPAARDAVGRNCMGASLLASREARATAYAEGDTARTYGPVVLWNTGKGTALAGDLDALIGAGHHIAFVGKDAGFTLAIGRPGGEPARPCTGKIELSGVFNLSLPKFGPEPKIGEHIPLVSIQGAIDDSSKRTNRKARRQAKRNRLKGRK